MEESSPTPAGAWEAKAIRHTILVTFTVILSQIFLYLRGFLAARLLGPSLYGLWTGIKVIINNSEFTCMGLYEGMKREVPFSRGKGDFIKAQEMITTAFYSGILLVSLASTLLIGFAMLFAYRFDRTTLICLWIVAGILITRQTFLFFFKKYESEGRFYSRSKIELLSVWLGLPLSIGLMFPFQLYGFLIGIFLSQAITSWFAFRADDLIRRERFSVSIGMELMKVGLPIILVGLLLSALRSIDKMLILAFLDRTQLGYYGIAVTATSFMGFFPRSLRSVLYPRLLEKYGEGREIFRLKGFLTEPTLAITVLMLPLIGGVYLFMPSAIRIFLPQYLPSLTSMKVLILGYFFMALSEIPISILVGINLQKKLLLILLGSIVLLTALTAWALHAGFDIEGAAFAYGLTHLLLTGVLFVFTASQLHQSLREEIGLFAWSHLPFCYTLFALLWVERWISLPQNGMGALFVSLLSQYLVFLLLLAPLFILMDRKIRLLHRVLKAVRGKEGITSGSFFED